MPTKLLPKNKKIIIANWKMNPDSILESRKIFNVIKKSNFNLKKTVAVICPPVVFLNDLISEIILITLSTSLKSLSFLAFPEIQLDNIR